MDDEPVTFKRVRHRLSTLIEVMPKSAKEIYTGNLLTNIREDLVWIRLGLDELEKENGK